MISEDRLKVIIKEEVALLNEGYKEVILTLGLLLGGNMAISQNNAKELLSNPKPNTVKTIDTIMQNKSMLDNYLDDIPNFGIMGKPKLEFVDDWVRYKGMDFQVKPPILTGGNLLVGVRFPIN